MEKINNILLRLIWLINKGTGIFDKIAIYCRNSNIPIIHRFFSEPPKIFKYVILYGTTIVGVITLLLQADVFPQYNETLKLLLGVIGGAVTIASITKADKTQEEVK